MRPSRLHPAIQSENVRIANFRDGARLLPEHLVGFAGEDDYPNFTYDEWVTNVVNKHIEDQAVAAVFGAVRASHFGR